MSSRPDAPPADAPPADAFPADAPTADAPVRILLIDDDQVDRAAVKRALARSELPHELREAASGEAGLALARGETFDCVLLDYMLPGTDTFALLAALRGNEAGAQAVLMLTGASDQALALRLMRAGALDYLAKSEVTPSVLARAIRFAAARRQFQSELEAARREAVEKSEQLDALNRQKSLLFSIIAHDLRNPFQALLGLSEVLGDAVAARDEASIGRRADGIRRAATQACNLMEGLFAWASAQMDTVAVRLAAVALDAVVDEVLAVAGMAASDKGIGLQAAGVAVGVQAHRDMLSTVLRNLVSNATKFTLPGGMITITAGHDDGRVVVSVSDTGVGMDPARVADLFRLDRRSSTHGTAGEGGSGLGLLLCRDLLERQGSFLRVQSVVGQGSRFSFVLPEADAPAPVPAARATAG